MHPCVVHEFRVFGRHATKLTSFRIRVPCIIFKNLRLKKFMTERFDGGRREEREWFGDADLRGSDRRDIFRELERFEGMSCFWALKTEMLIWIKGC